MTVPDEQITAAAGTLFAAIEPVKTRPFRRAVPICIAAVALICGAVVVGWLTGISTLATRWPSLFVMKFNTAAVMLMFDVAMLGLFRGTGATRWLTWTFGLAGMALSLSILTEYLLHISLGVDQWLVADSEPIQFPGRTSPGTAACFVLIGAATLLTDLRRARTAAQLLFIFAAVTPLVALGGYLYHTPGLTSAAKIPIVAVQTAVCQSLLCVAGLCVRPNAGLMRMVVSDSLAGSLARKLLPLAVILPLTVGLLVSLGDRAGIYSVQFGSALLVSCCALFYAAAVWLTTSLLWNVEKVRAVAESKLRKSERQLRTTVAERDAALLHERATRTEVERASRMKDEFLATLSHELRTPLNAILGWAQILSGGVQSANDLTEGLATIERNARAQTRIVEDLLDMSRIISGNLRLEVQPVQLKAVITAAIETVQVAADARNVTLVARVDPAIGLISADPHRLQQVIWNLLSNAIRFTPKEGRVTVQAACVESHLEVAVIDTGEGIPVDFLPYVFDRFRQADSSTTRRHGGLGLGLAIVRQLIELHGGSVDVTSDGEGRGTTFTLTLPLNAIRSTALADTNPVEGDRNNSSTAGPRPEKLGGLKVLVVDDEADARHMLQRILQDSDAVVTLAGSTAEAMRRLVTDLPDVLVSDIGMPGDDGYSLIRQVRSLTTSAVCHIPALALTAYSRPEDRLKALRAGFQMHLTKPAEPAELVTVIASLGRMAKLKLTQSVSSTGSAV